MEARDNPILPGVPPIPETGALTPSRMPVRTHTGGKELLIGVPQTISLPQIGYT